MPLILRKGVNSAALWVLESFPPTFQVPLCIVRLFILNYFWSQFMGCSSDEHQQQPFNGPLSGTTQVGWYQKKHSPTHTLPDQQPSIINFLHPLWSTASSLFNLHAWQSLFHNLSPGPCWSTSRAGTLYFILPTFLHQSLSSFCNTYPYHRNLFCCSTKLCHLFLLSLASQVWSTLGPSAEVNCNC